MIFYFGKTRTDGTREQKSLLGGKGANLAEMTGIGLPVPPGFTITTSVCADYYRAGKKFPSGLVEDVHRHVQVLEKELGKKFGDTANPLLVSVRSGAAVSMPGMMNTILNLGLNDQDGPRPGDSHGERAVRLRRLPPLDQYVRGRRDGSRSPSFRNRLRCHQEEISRET